MWLAERHHRCAIRVIDGFQARRRTRSGAAAAALALAIVVGVACAAERPFVWVHDLPLLAADQPVIAARDTIVVDVRNQATLSGEFVVGDAGVYRHPTLGTITSKVEPPPR